MRPRPGPRSARVSSPPPSSRSHRSCGAAGSPRPAGRSSIAVGLVVLALLAVWGPLHAAGDSLKALDPASNDAPPFELSLTLSVLALLALLAVIGFALRYRNQR